MRVTLTALVIGASLLAPAQAAPMGAAAGHLDGSADTSGAATRTNDHWSGYSAHSGDYTTVSASWTEPTVDCRTGGEVVFWGGLDGDGNDNVEQTGTHVLCRNGKAIHTGWWETYPCYNIIDYNHVVQPGDKISSTVTDNGNGTYRLYLDHRANQATHSSAAEQFDLEQDRVVPRIVTRGPDRIAFATSLPMMARESLSSPSSWATEISLQSR